MASAVPAALTVAGSDPCGGAGIQADLRTMSAYRVHGMAALTAVTVQNTSGVAKTLYLRASLVAAQVEAVVGDIRPDAVKTGMLGTAETVEAVAESVRKHGLGVLVVDPVMVATSGDALAESGLVEALKRSLLPLAFMVTPNVHEARALSGVEVDSQATMRDAARAILDLGAARVLVKGGHLSGDAVDILYDGEAFEMFSAPRVSGAKVHGTGCALSAAIASGLARGWPVVDAIARAKAYVTRGIAAALDISRGSALVNHVAAAEALEELS